MANLISGLSHPQLQPSPARPATGPSANTAEKPVAGKGGGDDTVTLTGSAQLLSNLESRIEATSTLDQNRVTVIKQEIASGAYTVNADQVAQQIAKFEKELGAVDSGVKRDINVVRGENEVSVSVTAHGAGGQERSRELSYQFDPATGTITRDRNHSVTNAAGQTIERSASLTRTENGFTHEVSRSNAQGNTITRTVEQSYDAESNTVSRVRTIENSSGDTTTVTSSATQGEDGPFIKSAFDLQINPEDVQILSEV